MCATESIGVFPGRADRRELGGALAGYTLEVGYGQRLMQADFGGGVVISVNESTAPIVDNICPV